MASVRAEPSDPAAHPQVQPGPAPPGNKLEALKGGRAWQHSIRINDQYRVCFRWTAAGVEAVEIVDYH